MSSLLLMLQHGSMEAMFLLACCEASFCLHYWKSCCFSTVGRVDGIARYGVELFILRWRLALLNRPSSFYNVLFPMYASWDFLSSPFIWQRTKNFVVVLVISCAFWQKAVSVFFTVRGTILFFSQEKSLFYYREHGSCFSFERVLSVSLKWKQVKELGYNVSLRVG